MVALKSPNGVEVHVRESQVERLLELGYRQADESSATKRRTARKTRKASDKN